MSKFDIFLGLILVWGAISGSKKGLIQGIAGVAGYVIGLVGAMAFYQPFANFLNNAFGLRGAIAPVVKSMVDLPDSVVKLPIEKFSRGLVDQEIMKMKMPASVLNELKTMVAQLSQFQHYPGVKTVADGLILLIADVVVVAISFVILTFVLERTVNWFAKKFKDHALPAPIQMLDGSIGAVMGLIKSSLSIFVFLMVLVPIMQLQLESKGLLALISKVMFDSKIVTACMKLINTSLM